MSDSTKNKRLKTFKIALIVLVIFVGIQLVGRFLLNTNIVHQFVKGKIEKLGGESLNGTFTIGDLEGDLWTEILLTNVSIETSKPIFSADTLYINYDMWSFLSGPYSIPQIWASGVFLEIEESKDSIFNVQELVKEPAKDEEIKKEPASFIISSIQLRDINLHLVSPSYLPDSSLKIKTLNADAFFEKTESIGFGVSSLSFLVEEGRLPEPIKVNTSGSLIGEQITLQEMVIETGRSMLKAQASTSLSDSTLNGEANTTPFSLSDIEPYLDLELPKEELEFSISASGSLKDLKLDIKLDHVFVPNFELVARLDLSETPTVNSFGILGDGLDLAGLTQDSIKAKWGDFKAGFSGKLVSDIKQSDISWGFAFSNVIYEEYLLEQVVGNGTLKNQTSLSSIELFAPSKNYLKLMPTIRDVFSTNPEWELTLDARRIDLSHWTANEELTSRINLKGEAKGTGFTLGKEDWTFSLSTYTNEYLVPRNKNLFMDQSFSDFKVAGLINQDELSVDGLLRLFESEIYFDSSINDLQTEEASYIYSLNTKGFDLSEINQLTEFPTSVNMNIIGDGIGLNPEECEIRASVNIDSSLVNGAIFEQLTGGFSFKNGILTISDGLLNSEIMEGTFNGRKNVLDETDPENWLTVDMEVKNIQPLAPLLNAEILNAVGFIEGRITQDTNQILRGNMLVDFNDVVFDTVFSASKIKGESEVEMLELRTFDLNLNIESPVISGLTFQDIDMRATGVANKDTLQAKFDVIVIGSERGQLNQGGILTMNIPEERIDIQFNYFDFVTASSQLLLQNPFGVYLNSESISVDTLDLKSNSGAFIKLAIPYADSVEQYGWVDGKNFDFGLIQEVIFGERFLDGVLSGGMVFNRSLEDVTGNGELYLNRVEYQGIQADSLAFAFDVQQEILRANGSINWGGEEKIVGNLEVPIVLLDITELEDSFFQRPVKGSLKVNPSELIRFKPILEEFGITETDGILDFYGTMSGTAGEPNFKGEMTLNEPVLSGIELDTVVASFNYDNIAGGLEIESEISARGQKAANLLVKYPIAYDFRTLKVIFPDDEDKIQILAKTKDFNIAVFNDFLDEKYLNNLKGTLNADLILEGPGNRMTPKGFLKLSGGKVDVPIAGITIDGLKSDMEFTHAGLSVKEISAKSGKGTFNANGTVSLEGIIPKTVNLTARANQFKLANTNDYNLVIDMNSKLTGNAKTPKATGKVTVRNGFVFLPDFGDNVVEEVQLDSEEVSSFSPYDSIQMEMEFEIQKNFYVRTRDYLDMEVELTGKLDAQKKTAGDLSLFGTLTGVRGYIRPLGKLFNVEEANFTFSGPQDDPDIYIESKYTPPTRQKGESVLLYYIIEGTLQEQEYRFDSNPQMEESDIICFTIFGKPCYSLESWQSIFASGESTSATDVLTDVLLDEVEALATRQLGVDVVQIDNTGTSGGTSIKTGWYLNERTFFAIINEISGSTPKTLFVLEYILNEKWDLIMTQGEDSRRGIDFRFQLDY